MRIPKDERQNHLPFFARTTYNVKFLLSFECVCVCVCVSRFQVNAGVFNYVSSYLWKQGLSMNLKLTSSFGLSGQQTPGLLLYLPLRTRATESAATSGFLCGSW